MLGMSLLGRSGYALLLAITAGIYCHYYIVNAEEPYLEHVFGKEYIKYKLSMGEKRIVALASILVYEPDILMFDEPTANLSSRFVKQIKQVITDAKNVAKPL
ncbi:MAG: hypothetical protein DRJ47_09490 [Thermoprotei archaeon]|nr:MAG: hypothetical protein DRJ47_09490 [Thermoprotei archaeon]